jgi:hypothetical protein
MAELYFVDKKIGLGAGIGQYGNTLPHLESEIGDKKSMYVRFALLLRNSSSKVGLFFQKYDDSTLGFGIQYLGGLNFR